MKLRINIILYLSLVSFSGMSFAQEATNTNNQEVIPLVLKEEHVSDWIKNHIERLSCEEVQFVANTLLIFYNQAFLQSALQKQLIALGSDIAALYSFKDQGSLHSEAKLFNERSLQIKEITFQNDYVVCVMNQLMQFWQEQDSYKNAYKALEAIGVVDLTLHADVAAQCAPFLKDDLRAVSPELKNLEKMLSLYAQIYTDIATDEVRVESAGEENKKFERQEVVRTALIMSENLVVSITNMFEAILAIYGYNALLGHATALRYAQWYTAVYNYMIEQNFEKKYFAILFDDSGIISEEKRVYYLSKIITA